MSAAILGLTIFAFIAVIVGVLVIGWKTILFFKDVFTLTRIRTAAGSNELKEVE